MIERALFSVHLQMSCRCLHSSQVNRRCCYFHRDKWLLIRLLSYYPSAQRKWMNAPKPPIDQWLNAKWHVHAMLDYFRWLHSIQSPTDLFIGKNKTKNREIKKCVVQQRGSINSIKQKRVRKKPHDHARANNISIIIAYGNNHNKVATLIAPTRENNWNWRK